MEDKARNFGLKHRYFPVLALTHIDIIIYIYTLYNIHSRYNNTNDTKR